MKTSEGQGEPFRLAFPARREGYVISEGENQLNKADAREDKEIRLALVDKRPLTRMSFSAMLRTEGLEFTVSSFCDVDDLLRAVADNHSEVDLVLLSVGAEHVSDHRGCFERLRQTLAHVPVVVLSDCDDTVCIRQAFRYGVRGYLPTTLNPAAVIEGLRLVRSGGTFVPAAPPLKDLEHRLSAAVTKHYAKPDTLEGLTPRQREVIQGLEQAKSNKEIALELQMQESTVKLHVRHILQKLKVTNRTHAALLASQMRLR